MAPQLGKGPMDPQMMDMMKFYSSKWRSKSIFQVLLRYRAARYQDLVQFSQQVGNITDDAHPTFVLIPIS